jgi:hypothetical protein
MIDWPVDQSTFKEMQEFGNPGSCVQQQFYLGAHHSFTSFLYLKTKLSQAESTDQS